MLFAKTETNNVLYYSVHFTSQHRLSSQANVRLFRLLKGACMHLQPKRWQNSFHFFGATFALYVVRYIKITFSSKCDAFL